MWGKAGNLATLPSVILVYRIQKEGSETTPHPDSDGATLIECINKGKAFLSPDSKQGQFCKERLMGHHIVSLLEVYEYHVQGWLIHNPSALYDFHYTCHLHDTFLALAKATSLRLAK